VVLERKRGGGDGRINGKFARLAGLEKAREERDEHRIRVAIERILLGYALICGFGGMPLLYMGDELGLLNDYQYTQVPDHASDSRWVHRPVMDWERAARRHDVSTVEGRLFTGILSITQARRRTQQLSARYDTEILDLGHPSVFANINRHPIGSLIGLYNFTEQTQLVRIDHLPDTALLNMIDEIEQQQAVVSNGHIHLSAYGRLWIS